MATQVIMPQLGESVVEGTVSKWLKTEGETVNEFEALLEVNTDKVDTEIPSPASGLVLKIVVPEGVTVQAGTVLAVIGVAGEVVPEELRAALPARPSSPDAAPAVLGASAAPAVPVTPAAPAKAELGFVSPVVAKIAAEHHVDLSQVRGSGAGGRITKKDVLEHVQRTASSAAPAWEQPASGELFRPTEEVFGTKAPASGPAPGQVVPHDSVRRMIAEHMVRSRRTSPHVTTVMEADLTRVVAHRQTHREIFARDGVDLTFTAYFVAAAVSALKAVPWVNASWSDEGIVLHRQVHVGVAVSLGEQGLIVPVIKDAEQKSLLAIAAAVKDLATRARARRLKPEDVQGGTFTITNHGVSGSLFATPIINQPQAAILGIGKMQKRVVVIETPGADAFAIRPMVYLTLTFDHRMLDGAVADRFLAHVVERLESWA